MSDAMVTGRMAEKKKKAGAAVLKREGLNTSQAINLMYDKMIRDGNTNFLDSESSNFDKARWIEASRFIDSIPVKRESRFDEMTKSEIRMDRLTSRGLA